MVDCLQCSEDDSFHNIDDLEYNENVRAGDKYTIVVYTSRKWYSTSGYQRLCLWEGGNEIANSGSIHLGRDEVKKTIFTGIMPNHDMIMNISLQNEVLGMIEGCEDGRDFIIRLSDITSQIPSPYIPSPPPSEKPESISEPWIPPWEKAENDITNTIIIVGAAVVIVALILKRK